MTCYVLAVAASVPGAVFLTLVGGFSLVFFEVPCWLFSAQLKERAHFFFRTHIFWRLAGWISYKLVRAHAPRFSQVLIASLNPLLRGWANYHRHVVSKRIFSRVSCEIWKCLWRWAIKRHPKKGKRWVKARYFLTWKERDWVFACKSKKPEKIPITKLICLSDTNKTAHQN